MMDIYQHIFKYINHYQDFFSRSINISNFHIIIPIVIITITILAAICIILYHDFV